MNTRSRRVATLMRYLSFVLASGLAALACSSSESAGPATDAAVVHDATPDGGSDAARSCVLRDGGCGEGCCGQEGRRWDQARDCLDPKTQIIGCAPVPAGTNACAFLGVVGCAVTPEGTWFTPSRAAGWEAASACSDAVSAKVQVAKDCAAADAATD